MVGFWVADLICRPIFYELSLFFSTLPFVLLFIGRLPNMTCRRAYITVAQREGITFVLLTT